LEIDRYRTPNALRSDRYNKRHPKRIRALTSLAGTRDDNLPIGSPTSLPAHDKIRCGVLRRGCVIVALRDRAHAPEKQMGSGSDEQNGGSQMRDLASHVAPYLTVGELARYWLVSRRQIYKQIEEGKLPAIRLGPRSLRVRTSDAIQFERRSSLALPETDGKPQSTEQRHWPTAPVEKRRNLVPIGVTKRV
jgi:excisionase family DNA binding protein